MCGPESFRTHRKAGSDELLKTRIIFRSIVDGDIDYMVLSRVFRGGGGGGGGGRGRGGHLFLESYALWAN